MRARFTGICYACGHFNEAMIRAEAEAEFADMEHLPCEHCRARVMLVRDPGVVGDEPPAKS